MMSQQAKTRAIEIFKEHSGVMTTKDAVGSGVQYRTLYEMRDQGLLERVSRGRYRLSELPPLSDPDLAVVGLRIPRGVVCLISALAFHQLTTQIPHSVYIALPRGSEEPRLDHPPISIFKFSGQAFSEGIEVHEIDGINVRVYSSAKTVADCFKFRNQIGMDVAIEALKSFRSTSGFDVTELMKFARICRVDKIIRPYIEAVL
jgi:predicted transcriptional regulator of viral defense system